jgi:hypothetical protein
MNWAQLISSYKYDNKNLCTIYSRATAVVALQCVHDSASENPARCTPPAEELFTAKKDSAARL